MLDPYEKYFSKKCPQDRLYETERDKKNSNELDNRFRRGIKNKARDRHPSDIWSNFDDMWGFEYHQIRLPGVDDILPEEKESRTKRQEGFEEDQLRRSDDDPYSTNQECTLPDDLGSDESQKGSNYNDVTSFSSSNSSNSSSKNNYFPVYSSGWAPITKTHLDREYDYFGRRKDS